MSCSPRSAGSSTSPAPVRGERLVVTAVASPDDEGEQPSRFLTELGVEVRHQQGRPPRPLSLLGLVSELRRTASDPRIDRRRSATPPLRRLAAPGRRSAARTGAPLVPAADPATWWGTRDLSHAEQPVRPADEPVELSASALAGLVECPAKWFLEREAGGRRAKSSQAQGFGNLVHAIADRVAKGELGCRSRGRRRADGARRRRVGPARLPHPVVPRARARGGAQGPHPVRDLARPAGRAHGAGDRAGHAGRGRRSPTASGSS